MTKIETQLAADQLVSERLPVRDVDWSAQEVEQKLQAFHLRKSRGHGRKPLWAAAALCLAACAAFGLFPLLSDDAAQPKPSASLPEAPSLVDDQRYEGKGLVRFADGSQAELRDNESQLLVQQVSSRAVTVELLGGQASFQVTPRPGRQFRVVTQGVEVTVIGTEFSVSHQPGRVHVGVVRGKVRVKSAHEARLLIGGEAAWFEVDEPEQAAADDLKFAASQDQARVADGEAEKRGSLAEGAVRSAEGRTASESSASDLRQQFIKLHQQAAYAEAYRVLSEKRDVVGATDLDLMRAADVARYSGHPAEALKYLERVSAQGSQGLAAAFTRGRLLLHELNRPAEAAQAFADVQRLSPGGPLAEDALYREIEARTRAGQKSQVARLAQLFAERYPQSRRREAVKQLVMP